MPKFESPTPTKAPYTVDLQHFMENVQELNYPVELFKDSYRRVVMAHREHWQALRDGWSEEAELDVEYQPLSAHPDNVAKAKKQQADLVAKQEAERIAKEGKGMVRMEDVQAMIQAALLSQPSNPVIED